MLTGLSSSLYRYCIGNVSVLPDAVAEELERKKARLTEIVRAKAEYVFASHVLGYSANDLQILFPGA